MIPVENERKVLRKYPAKSKDYFTTRKAPKGFAGAFPQNRIRMLNFLAALMDF